MMIQDAVNVCFFFGLCIVVLFLSAFLVWEFRDGSDEWAFGAAIGALMTVCIIMMYNSYFLLPFVPKI